MFGGFFMTVTEAIVLTMLVALWSTGNGVNLANNTTFLIVMLIALVSLAYSTTRRGYCQNQYLNSQNGGLFNSTLFT